MCVVRVGDREWYVQCVWGVHVDTCSDGRSAAAADAELSGLEGAAAALSAAAAAGTSERVAAVGSPSAAHHLFVSFPSQSKDTK